MAAYFAGYCEFAVKCARMKEPAPSGNFLVHGQKVYKMSPESLDDYDVDDARLCDTRIKIQQHKHQATSYCTDCSMKFCKEHLEHHDVALGDHHTDSMTWYMSNESQHKPDICTKHENQPPVFGCKVCHTISCMKCVADSSKCEKGGPHDFLLLEDLASSLLNTIKTEESTTKDGEYERLFKEVSKVQSNFDDETQAMLLLIHNTRDSQLNEIKLKYDTLEKRLLENRQQSQTKIADFIEDELLKQWISLRTKKELLETETTSYPPAAIVREFKELKAELDRIAKEDLPKLKLTDQLQLKQTGERRDMELEVISACHIIVKEQGAPPVQFPKSLTRLSSVQMPSAPLSICHYKGNTYIGLRDNTVSRVDMDNNVTNGFISTSGQVESVTCYKNKLYTLSHSSPLTVSVYSMEGELITSWEHPYHIYFSDMLVIINDKVLLSDPPNSRITTYSLDGQVLHHMPCPLTVSSHVTIRSPDNSSLILSSFTHSKICKIDTTTHEVMWTLTQVKRPEGLVSYGEYILLTAHNNKTIYIINSTTGNIVSQMAHRSIDAGSVPSLEVSGSTLILPKYNSKEVSFYKMN
ncbi:uncharacterized protein [Watersipora subatra]|uniref:uncharacterized protein n=1 Tax=Watersipora subatra TaxID=2589382 RepID=UPI00355BB5AE